jgi:hypothetical protein
MYRNSRTSFVIAAAKQFCVEEKVRTLDEFYEKSKEKATAVYEFVMESPSAQRYLEKFLASGKEHRVAWLQYVPYGRPEVIHAGKKVRDNTTGKVYRTLSECARMTGLNKANISKVCHGVFKQTGGHSFSFDEDEA